MNSLYASTQYPDDLQQYVDAGAVESRDLRAVSMLLRIADGSRDVDELAWVALALVLGVSRSGHTCVDFVHIDLWAPESATQAVRWPTGATDWVAALSTIPDLVCSPAERTASPRRPFVLDGTRLYASRSYEEELFVAEYLRTASAAGRLTIITGGPGSGKTTKVAHRIVAHLSGASAADTVALAAPTGLAAKRMDRALRSAVAQAVSEGGVPAGMENLIDGLPKLTVHKLLRYNPVARVQWRFNAKDRMPYDLVVVDEVSMMPLSLMARLLEAMKDGAELILVGDPHQLASVDAGTVLADIVEASARGVVRVETLKGENHRFGEGSPVDDIATHTKSGDADAALAAVRHHASGTAGNARFEWVDPVNDDAALQKLARMVADHARKLCELAAGASTPDEFRAVHEFRDSLQVVCAHRRGNLGVSGWNSAVERQLGQLARGQWYVGRPVMVTRNDSFSGLSNGDIGVVCRDANDRPVVVFGDSQGVTVLPVARVPHVETVHALTIHKSQGSEFDHTVVVLPKGRSRILTRELLYTGMTRAKPHLTIVATEEALRAAIGTKVQRATGLAGLL